MPAPSTDEVLNAIARFMEGPKNPAYANIDMMEVFMKHWRIALSEKEELDNIYLYNQDLEAENAELRRRLKNAGISDKIDPREVAA